MIIEASDNSYTSADPNILHRYIKLMYNVRIGLVLLLMKKNETLNINDVRKLSLYTILD